MRTAEFAHAAGADGVIIHRYLGFVRGGEPIRIPRGEAEHQFEEEVKHASRALAGRQCVVDWLRPAGLALE